MLGPMTLLIYGTGGMGREAAQCLRDLSTFCPSDDTLVGFIDNHALPGQIVHGLPVLPLTDAVRQHPGAAVVVAVGNPSVRRDLADRVLAAALREITVVHPTAQVGDRIALGRGCYLAPGAVLTCDATLGRQVQVNVGTFVHHDCVVGDFVTLSPRVTLCGNVRVGEGAFLGAGATVKQGVRIGAAAVIGMGAVVIRDVPDGETWVGVPAHRLNP